MKFLATTISVLEVVWTALVWGGLMLLGDESAGRAMVGLVIFLVWGTSQFALVPMTLLALGYLAIDWMLDGERRQPYDEQAVNDQREPRSLPPA